METNKKQGIFYATIGVATLIVTIIGATFAYFSATASNNGIVGSAATTGIDLKVTHISTDANGGLIPLAEDKIANALAGDIVTNNKTCIDKNGNTVCQLYRIDVENKGDITVNFTGTLVLTPSGQGSIYNDLKWANFDKNNGQTFTGTNYPSAPTQTTSNLQTRSDTELTTNEVYAAHTKKSYFILVYIANENAPQENTNKGTFSGTVTFNSADGQGVKAEFGNSSASTGRTVYAVNNSSYSVYKYQPLPEGVNVYNSAAQAMADWTLSTDNGGWGLSEEKPYYLKYVIGDFETESDGETLSLHDVVIEAYVGFVMNGRTYELQGWVDEYNLSSEEQLVYNSNVDTIKQAFDYEHYPDRCSDYSSYFSCSFGGLNVDAYTDGNVYVIDGGSHDCTVGYDGTARCS